MTPSKKKAAAVVGIGVGSVAMTLVIGGITSANHTKASDVPPASVSATVSDDRAASARERQIERAARSAAQRPTANPSPKPSAKPAAKKKPVAQKKWGGPRERTSTPLATWRASAKAKSVLKCESHFNYKAVSGTGKYRGAWQMDSAFWRTYGGLEFAARPELASPAEQDLVAYRGWLSRGWQPWGCA